MVVIKEQPKLISDIHNVLNCNSALSWSVCSKNSWVTFQFVCLFLHRAPAYVLIAPMRVKGQMSSFYKVA